MAAGLELTTPIAPPLQLRRFSVQQYHRLGELGILTAEDRVELLEGWIVEKVNQRPIHGYLVGVLAEWFQTQLPPGFCLRCQLPITTERSEPEPDLAIAIGEHMDYRQRHPAGTDCPLVVEVADTSLDKDRAKAEIYRLAGVGEYWIINVNNRTLERYQFAGQVHACAPQPVVLTVENSVGFNLGQLSLALDLRMLFGP